MGKNRIKQLDKEISDIHKEAVADSESFGNSAKVRESIRQTNLEEKKEERRSILAKKKVLPKVIGVIVSAVFFISALAALVWAAIQMYDRFTQDTLVATEKYLFANSSRPLDINVEDLQEADCWVSSHSTNRADAYRCSSGNYIFDPCFRDYANRNLIICPSDPYSENSYFRVDSNNLPKNEFDDLEDEQENRPWYVKLQDGAECRLLTGASALVADMRIDYGCTGGQYNSLLLPITEDDSLLKINCFDELKIASCVIKEAWY